jgi:ATP-dependent RNA helicase RhlE
MIYKCRSLDPISIFTFKPLYLQKTLWPKFNLPKSVKSNRRFRFYYPPIGKNFFCDNVWSWYDGIATKRNWTFAYLLPLLKLYKFIQDILKNSNPSTTHIELVVQVVEEVEKLTKYKFVRLVFLVEQHQYPKQLFIKVATYW